MASPLRLAIVSDIHYASEAERARGNDYETRTAPNWWARAALTFYRRHVWLRAPLDQNPLLDRFLAGIGPVDWAVANGDYACDSAFISLSDPATLASATECLGKLRAQFGGRFSATFGDHELGKVNFLGTAGHMLLRNWELATQALGLEPFWRVELGRNVLLGVVSSLIALPVYEADTLPGERAAWRQLRAQHLAQLRDALAALRGDARWLLFCHDPSALPFLLEEEAVRCRLPQLDATIIGHLHSPLVFWKSRRLAGCPRVTFLGQTVKRMTTALRQARHWRPFKVRLCPSLAGIQLCKDGGYLTAELDPDARQPARFTRRRLQW